MLRFRERGAKIEVTSLFDREFRPAVMRQLFLVQRRLQVKYAEVIRDRHRFHTQDFRLHGALATSRVRVNKCICALAKNDCCSPTRDSPRGDVACRDFQQLGGPAD